jgi:hypothetical protein
MTHNEDEPSEAPGLHDVLQFEWSALNLDFEFPEINPSTRAANMILEIAGEAERQAQTLSVGAFETAEQLRLNMAAHEVTDSRRTVMEYLVRDICLQLRVSDLVDDPVGHFVGVVAIAQDHVTTDIEAGFFRGSTIEGQLDVASQLAGLLALEAEDHVFYRPMI